MFFVFVCQYDGRLFRGFDHPVEPVHNLGAALVRTAVFRDVEGEDSNVRCFKNAGVIESPLQFVHLFGEIAVEGKLAQWGADS